MDIDKQLGAITAEFWSQIGTTNTSSIANDHHTIKSADTPFTLLNNKGQDIIKSENDEKTNLMEVEQEDSQPQRQLVVTNEDNSEIELKQANYQQTLSDIIDETLSKSSKSTPPPKVGRSRKISRSYKQGSANLSNYSSTNGAPSSFSNNASINIKQESPIQMSDNISVGDWLDNSDKQQTLDREEKAIQRKKANNKNKKWTPQELQRLYDLLECFGTDFTTIQQYFDKKTVTQIKNKFHKEEKDNPEKIKEILFCKGSNKRLSIKLENERDFQTFQQYYIDKYLHSNLNALNGLDTSSSNSSTPLSLPSPQSSNNENNQQSLISRIPACIHLPSESLKIVADDIERRLLKERTNTQ